MTATGHVAIVGMGRSGSTFLEGVLARDLGGVAVGELPGVWSAIHTEGKLCACGKSPSTCRFWSEVLRRCPALVDADTAAFMREVNQRTLSIDSLPRWFAMSRAARRNGAEARKYVDEAVRLYAALANVAVALGYRTVVDSSKHPLWYHLAHRAGALEAFDSRVVIRLIRDPRGVAYSLQRPKSERRVGGDVLIQRAYGSWRALPYWAVMNVGAEVVAAPPVVTVRYEDLAMNQAYQEPLRAAGFHVVEGPSDGPDDGQHQLVANPTRQAGTRNFAIDDQWRRECPPRAERVMWYFATPLLARYGYRPRRHDWDSRG